MTTARWKRQAHPIVGASFRIIRAHFGVRRPILADETFVVTYICRGIAPRPVQPARRLRRLETVDTIWSSRRSLDMRLTDILKPQNILIPMAAKTKNEAIGEL